MLKFRHPLLVFFIVVLITGCQYDPYAHLFTTAQPKREDVMGSYVLTQQTITQGALSFLQDRQCLLDLESDGSFTLTDYPTWTEPFSPTNGQFLAVISTTGRWSCDTVGTVSDGRRSQSHWGIRFVDTNSKIESLALTGKAPPYGLIMTYGDPDSGQVMILEKKK